MDTPDRDHDAWITSKDLLEITGLSRATLNNYIKYAIIPKPVVKRPEGINIKEKKIGHFPRHVLNRINKVSEMKREGKSMESIARVFSINSADAADSKKTGNLKLTINDIKSPAYLLNYKFEIEWINPYAEEKIFNQNISAIRDVADRNIFKLFSKMGYLRDHKDHPLVKYFIQFVKSRHERIYLKNLFNGISERELQYFENMYDTCEPSHCDSFQETYVSTIEDDGTRAAYNIYHVVFREGILFVHAPVEVLLQEVMDLLSRRGKVITELMKQKMPTLISFCVLVADLQDSSRICAELPPDEYFTLIRDIWKCVDEIFPQYYGIYGKHVGDGMVFYFLKNKDENYIKNSLYCASQLREKMKQLNLEWKIKKNWFNDLYLNIGINEGQEFFGTTPSSPMELTALGDSVNYAGRLSDLARFGAIWTTKNLISRLDTADRKKIHFGIRRKENDREVFIENIFSRVVDMLHRDDPKYSKFMDIATLAVTEVVSIVPSEEANPT